MAEGTARKLLVTFGRTGARLRSLLCCPGLVSPWCVQYTVSFNSLLSAGDGDGTLSKPLALQVRDGELWGGMLRHRADRDGGVRVSLRACGGVGVSLRACGCAAPVAMRSPVPAPTSLTLHPPARQALVNVASNMCMLPAIYVAMLQGLRFEAGVQRHPLARRTRGTCSVCSQMTAGAHIVLSMVILYGKCTRASMPWRQAVSALREARADGRVSVRAAVGVFAISVSSLYHFCEPTGYRIYGMNDGQWHRLDNIGAWVPPPPPPPFPAPRHTHTHTHMYTQTHTHFPRPTSPLAL